MAPSEVYAKCLGFRSIAARCLYLEGLRRRRIPIFGEAGHRRRSSSGTLVSPRSCPTAGAVAGSGHLELLGDDDWSARLVTVKTVNASEFKAKCLAILDEVAATGEHVTILKHGEPVAPLFPPVPRAGRYPQRELAGTIEFLGDVVAPAVESDEWEALADRS